MHYIIYSLLLLFCPLIVAQNAKQAPTLEDIVKKGTFRANSVYGLRSTHDGLHYTTLSNNKIEKFTYAKGESSEVLFDIQNHPELKGKIIQGYELSPKEDKILFYVNMKNIYRHSFTANYYLFNLKNKTVESLSENGPQQLATFSPDGNKVAFVRENNIYLKHLDLGTESAITTDGQFNKIINGAPDWVYEEEFGFSKAFVWSPNSRFLAFIRFDESEVKQFSFPLYDAGKNKDYELYPGSYEYKYPKAGEDNSKVSVHVHDLQIRKTSPIKLDGIPEDHYIPRITWTPHNDKLAIFVLNRRQDQLSMFYANPQSTLSKEVFRQTSSTYLEQSSYNDLTFLEDGEHFVYMGENDGFRHLYLYKLNGALKKQLTTGQYDVTQFLGYDSKSKAFYYQAAAKKPTEREVYMVNRNGKVSCITPEPGTNTVQFSNGFNYYIHYFSNSTTPTQVTLYNSNNKVVSTLEKNTALLERLKNYHISPKEFFTFTTNDNMELHAWMVKPHNFDEQKQYPLLMVQYSGPNSQQVLNRWEIGWEQHLANMGYIVACVDGRGTGARGEAFRKCTYLQLGHLESDDQIEAARHFGNLAYIDASRIGIWGWSYGGFMSSLCLSRGNGIFKAGIAVAPVTHWKYYDNIYTERYMRQPKENKQGYNAYSPLELTDQLQGMLLLCHGSADDNVHYQNVMEYADRLVRSNKQFEMQIYPNKDHSIRGANTRHHLYTRFCNFLERYL